MARTVSLLRAGPAALLCFALLTRGLLAYCLLACFAWFFCAVLGMFDYIFAENGLVAFKQGELLGSQTLKKYLGEDKLKQFINFTLKYLADLDIPIKR